MSASESAVPRFFCIRVRAGDPARDEWALAEAFAAGAVGVEEESVDGQVMFAVYAPADAREPVRCALEEAGAAVCSVAPVPPRDWSEAWKRDLGPIVVSPRLVLRPSFAAFEPSPGQHVLELDPGQAFGTGGHESTQLALEGLDALAGHFRADHVLLDVGTGTGVLSLAAVTLGCGRALALDLDPLAGQAARENAARNDLSSRLDVFVGGVEALDPRARFAFVAANLLAAELRPVLPAVAGHVQPGGHAVLSGLLAEQVAGVEALAASHGLRRVRALERRDASGVLWTALVMRREPAATSR